MDLNSLVILFVGVLGLGLYYVQRKYSYWAARGVPFIKPRFPFGTLQNVSFKMTLGEKVQEGYEQLKGKGPIGGLFFFVSPVALILELDLLRNIFVKDFSYFQNRGVYHNEKVDPLSGHLFAIEGDRWRNMRAKLSPTFTSGKMKMMHSTFTLVAEQLRQHLQQLTGGQSEIEIKELLAQFTTDIIGNVAFGIECNSLKDPQSAFRKAGRKVFSPTPWTLVKNFFLFTFPSIGHWLGIALTRKDVSEFFLSSIRATLEYREANNVQRNDFLQLLIQIKKNGQLEGDADDLGGLTFEELAAQTFVFFLAGFETSSSTMTFACYELALNQDIQERAREQLKEVLERHKGELNYEAAMELTYIDQIIQETLRKYPIASVLRRKVGRDYKVPNTDLVLEKDTVVNISVLGIHHDPEIYPEPEKFDPDRFTKENIAQRHPYSWLPFGEGPRNCIGMRFGLMQAKVGIATMLKSFRLEPSERTIMPMRFQPNSPVLSPQGGMFLRFIKL